MPATARNTDRVSCDDTCANGSENVITNELNTIRVGLDLTESHCFNPTIIQCGSPNVFVNELPMARVEDPILEHCCPGSGCHIGYIASGSPNVYANEKGDLGDCEFEFGGGGSEVGKQNAPRVAPASNDFNDELHYYITTHDAGIAMQDEPVDDNGLASYPINEATVAKSVANGYDPSGPAPVIEEIDPKPGGGSTALEECVGTDDGCCDEIKKLYEATDTPSFHPDHYGLELSENFNLRGLTLNPAVSRYRIRGQRVTDHTGAKVKLEEWEIVCNLQALAVNIIEPLYEYLKEKGYQIQINSGFRHVRSNNDKSQHFRGQAVDIQVPTYTYADYWDTAKWIRDNLPYDQFILEYGGINPWFHISYNLEELRQKLTTRVRPGQYRSGLIRVA